jgi:cytoskeletal protein CcmA (bactofilin family)
MVKNLPSVERSTKIRFGKHVPDSNDQEENTIVFNASNVLVPTPYSNSVYLSPIRNRPDYTAPEVVILMYDKITKEITESGESANALVGGVNLGLAVDRSNISSNCVQLIGGEFYDVSLVTDSNVGLSNFFPQHTLSVGSNLYIDDVGRNILVVSGNVSVLRDMTIEGNLTVNGETTIIYTENTSIKDALIELGKNNTSGDTTLDLGVLMHRPDALSNVVIGYREGTDEFAIAYTDAQPTDKTFTPKTDEDINVHVYGLTHVDANIYAHEDLLVTGNVYVSTNVNITEELTVSNNVYADKDLEVMGNVYADGNVVAYKDLLVTGNVYVSTNVDVTRELTVSGNVYADKDLEVMGNVYADGNVVAYKDLLVTGNVYVSTNVDVTQELTVSGNVYADKDLEVMGNVYADGNVVAYKDLLVTGNTYATGNITISRDQLIVSGNVYANKDLKLAGNAYVTGNVNVTKQLSVTVATPMSLEMLKSQSHSS